MAQIINNDESNATPASPGNVLWGASQLLLIGFIARFKKNYDRYKPEKARRNEVPDKKIVIRIAAHVIYKQQTFANLLTNPGEWNELTAGVSLLVLDQQIFDLLNDLHYHLLDHPVERIVDTVRLLDRQLAFWNPDSIDLSPSDQFKTRLDDIQRQMLTLQNDLIRTL